MKFQSIEEIRKEFNFDSSLSEDEIIKELTKLQKKMHPDANPKDADFDVELFSKIKDAKNFLRSSNEQTGISVYDVVDLIYVLLYKKMSSIEYEDKLSERILSCSERIYKNVKDYYLPKKISLFKLVIITSFLLAIAFFIFNSSYFTSNFHHYTDYFNLTLSLYGFIVLLTSILLFINIIKKEIFVKSILNEFGNTDLQFEIFQEFIKGRNIREVFAKSDMEEFLKRCIIKRYFGRIPDRNIFPYITGIAPKVTDMIIFRAINKGFISEIKDSWNDEYIFIYEKEI